MVEDVLRVELGDGKPSKRFRDVAALRQFLEAEMAFLHSLATNIDSEEARADVRQAGRSLIAAFQYLGQLESQEGVEYTRNGLVGYLGGQWPHEGTPERQLLEKLVQQAPAGIDPRRSAARYAFTLMYPGPSPLQGVAPREMALASFAVAALEFGADLRASPTFRDLAKSQKAANDRLLADLDRKVSELESEFGSRRAFVLERMQALNGRVIKNFRSFRKTRTKHWLDTKASIVATHQAYREQMRLQEPVKYWADGLLPVSWTVG